MVSVFVLILALHLIVLHGPGGQIIEINPNEVSSVRAPQAVTRRHFAPGIRCVITMTNGNFNAVVEPCDQVDKLLANSEGKEQ
jgi:hypothetical protein